MAETKQPTPEFEMFSKKLTNSVQAGVLSLLVAQDILDGVGKVLNENTTNAFNMVRKLQEESHDNHLKERNKFVTGAFFIGVFLGILFGVIITLLIE